MRTGDDDALLVVENGGQTFGAAQTEAAVLACGVQSHVFLANSGGVDDHLGIADSCSTVRTREDESGLLQTLCFRAGHAVAAADAVPHFQEHASQTAHAGTGYADKMDANGMLPIEKSFTKLINHKCALVDVRDII